MPSKPDLIDQDRAIPDAELARRDEQFRKSQEALARSSNQAERRIALMRRTYFQLRYPDDWREQMAAAQRR